MLNRHLRRQLAKLQRRLKSEKDVIRMMSKGGLGVQVKSIVIERANGTKEVYGQEE